MVEPGTSVRELTNMFEIFRLGLAIHLVAESRVLDTLVSIVRPPPSLRLQIAQLRKEHRQQQLAADKLTQVQAGSHEWYSCALELRVLVLDHAKREDYLRSTFEAHIPTPIGRGLVAQYATERMKLLASTSPVALARSEHAA